MSYNTKFLTLLFTGVVLALLGGFYVWFGLQKDASPVEVNSVIENVPSVTIYNHTGENSYVVTDLAAALVSVLKYYGENLSISDIQRINGRFFDGENLSELHQLEDIKKLAEELGYNATIEVPESINDFKKYFNSTRPTPAIFSHFMEVGQNPKIRFKPVGVLIGMLDKEQTVVIHDYYFGYNKKISYRDFGKLGAYPAQVLIITPKVPKRAGTIAVPAYARTPSMDKAEPIINKITLVRVAQGQKLYDVAADYLQSVGANPDSEIVLPPYYKVVALNAVARGYVLAKDYDTAMPFATRAEKLNHDLDKPFGDFWPGFVDGTNTVTNQFAGIYYWLGRIYEHKEDYVKARASYERALQIYPYGPSKAALQKLKTK